MMGIYYENPKVNDGVYRQGTLIKAACKKTNTLKFIADPLLESLLYSLKMRGRCLAPAVLAGHVS